MKYSLRSQFLFASSLIATALFMAAECSAEWRVPASAERIRVPNDGRFITVPVTVNGRAWDFLIDTGANVTLVDGHLRPDLKEFVKEHKTSSGLSIDLYRDTEFHVGAIRLTPNKVVGCCDLNWVRKISRLPIYGILGMDCLWHLVLHLDFKRGEGFVCADPKAIGEPVGEMFALEFDPSDRPMLTASYGNGDKLSHLIDTGCPRNGFIPHDAAERLEAAHSATDLGIGRENNVLDQASLLRNRYLKIDKLSIGGIALKDIVLDAPVDGDDAGTSPPPMLGLYFLRRFTCTFSFPEKKLWLSKTTPDERHDHSDMDGIVLGKFKNGNLAVISVSPKSVAQAAGLEKGDIIKSIDGRSAQGWEVNHTWEIIEAERLRPLELEILRNDQNLKILLPP